MLLPVDSGPIIPILKNGVLAKISDYCDWVSISLMLIPTLSALIGYDDEISGVVLW